MSALNLSWIPDDADDREMWAESVWPPEPDWPPPDPDDLADAADDPDWPPREQSTDTEWAAPTPKAKSAPRAEPKPLQSEPMRSLQRVVDSCDDRQALQMRRWGCDLIPARWLGRVPEE